MLFPGYMGKKMPMQVPLAEEVVEEFYSEPLEAWRAWNVIVIDNKMMLQSITYKTFWPFQEEMVAVCHEKRIGISSDYENGVPPHVAPSRDHACGIYAVKHPHQAIQWREYGSGVLPSTPPRVYGKIKIWGRILPYTEGYLVEKAYPSYLLVPHALVNESEDLDPREIRRDLEKNYRVQARLA